MLELPDVARLAGAFDPVSLTYPWRHPDPQVDALQELAGRLVGVRLNAPRGDAFDRVWIAAHSFACNTAPDRTKPVIARATVPYLNEPWYC